jgi:hypothetical protein
VVLAGSVGKELHVLGRYLLELLAPSSRYGVRDRDLTLVAAVVVVLAVVLEHMQK